MPKHMRDTVHLYRWMPDPDEKEWRWSRPRGPYSDPSWPECWKVERGGKVQKLYANEEFELEWMDVE